MHISFESRFTASRYLKRFREAAADAFLSPTRFAAAAKNQSTVDFVVPQATTAWSKFEVRFISRTGAG